jgi:hypothetical protein
MNEFAGVLPKTFHKNVGLNTVTPTSNTSPPGPYKASLSTQLFESSSTKQIKRTYFITLLLEKVKVKVKQSRYRPGVAQRVPGS